MTRYLIKAAAEHSEHPPWEEVVTLAARDWATWPTWDPCLVDCLPIWRLIMARVSAAMQLPRGNIISSSGGVHRVRDTSTKVVRMHIPQSLVLNVISHMLGRPPDHVEQALSTPKREVRTKIEPDEWNRLVGSKTVAWIVRDSADMQKLVRLEESTRAIASRSWGPAKRLNPPSRKLVVVMVPPLRVTHVERRDLLSNRVEELVLVFRVATISMDDKKPHLPPALGAEATAMMSSQSRACTHS